MNSVLDRCVQICQHLSKLSVAKHDELLFSTKKNKQDDEVLRSMKRPNYITMKIQRDNITIAHDKRLFKTVLMYILDTKILASEVCLEEQNGESKMSQY